MTNIARLDTQRIVQNQNYIASDMNGEKVMLDVQSGKYYNLGMIGGRIWDLSAQPATVDEIVARLLQEYDVAPELCKQQVSTFIGQMLSEGLVEIDDQDTASR
ncbi:lasso peptide biosynthesis PqqD family chaperone [Paenibacillus campi]|uniref:lasso peptide biosynthesis PqqD family chaperone n=1 Tax=Paenibacillus campi TaxID=3106031 RepID=UPI002AFF68BD|nr:MULTISPECIES: lasso peptide biosynthesis PqqD family chaperone [unclassified Paenibacillus]